MGQRGYSNSQKYIYEFYPTALLYQNSFGSKTQVSAASKYSGFLNQVETPAFVPEIAQFIRLIEEYCPF